MKNNLANNKTKRRLVLAFVIFCGLIFLLCIRIGYVQIVKSSEYSKQAIAQQKKDTVVSPKRGLIYDTNGAELAVNMQSYNVWVRPNEMKTGKTDAAKEENLEIISKQLAKLLGQDEDELVKTIKSSKQTLFKVAKNIDTEKADKIRKANLTGVSLSEEVQRYYPMGNFLSQVLGGVNDDNVGITGLESYYNSVLAGVNGRWVKNTDRKGNALIYGEDEYYEPQDGENLVLTINQSIQSYTEKSVQKAYKDNKAKSVSCVVMDVKTGEILSMASAPSYDPNNPYEPVDEGSKKTFETLDEDAKMDYLNNMWRNSLVSNVYEPGSTSKLITTAASLEEGLTNKDEMFNCSGSYTVLGENIKCWSYTNPHGSENLYKSVANSCNPVFIQLALRLGADRYYKYLDLFGISEATGIDFPGEARPIIVNQNKVTDLDLATMGFGQTNAVTPVQLITAVSALGNDGKLMQPHLVKKVTDVDGNTVKEYKPTVVRQAVSKETADEVCTIMKYVVDEEYKQNVQIAGYRVGGKTGTAQVASETGGYSDKEILSFIGMAPMDDPEVAILYIVDSPTTSGYAVTIAAPAARDLLKQILEYREVTPVYTDEEKASLESTQREVPNVVGKSSKEAITTLESAGFKYKVSPLEAGSSEFVVKEQYPTAGSKANSGSTVYIYKE